MERESVVMSCDDEAECCDSDGSEEEIIGCL